MDCLFALEYIRIYDQMSSTEGLLKMWVVLTKICFKKPFFFINKTDVSFVSVKK